jgi:DNA-binding XRE family transcriptional regulator
MGVLTMPEKKRCDDAFQLAYERYVGDDPDRVASYGEELAKAETARRIHDVRNKLGMSRDQLAEVSGLTHEDIEDIEESDYEGSWEDAVETINRAFRHWFTSVIMPAAKMSPDDYSVTVAKPRDPATGFQPDSA